MGSVTLCYPYYWKMICWQHREKFETIAFTSDHGQQASYTRIEEAERILGSSVCHILILVIADINSPFLDWQQRGESRRFPFWTSCSHQNYSLFPVSRSRMRISTFRLGSWTKCTRDFTSRLNEHTYFQNRLIFLLSSTNYINTFF